MSNRLIVYNDAQGVFHLNAKNSSYIMKVLAGGYLAHVHWGAKVAGYRGAKAIRHTDRSFSPNPTSEGREFSLDTTPLEYPAFGNTDFRVPAVQLRFADGSTVTDFRYDSHRIYEGKPALEGLPATYVEAEAEAETLEIVMKDSGRPVGVVLRYTVFRHYDAIARSVEVFNDGTEPVAIERALSMNVDFRDSAYDLLNLPGAWARERHIARRPVAMGTTMIESRRGASSHQQNPFIALMRKDAGEFQGEVYGFSLVYSGNFLAQVEVDQYRTTRVAMGINPFNFSWKLEPGSRFQTPETVMVYSAAGLNAMSADYHGLYGRRLCRGRFRDALRPVLVNNWEATYFDFDKEKILDIAGKAKPLGIELMVLDDGWFGKRDSDFSSLGDWVVNEEKLAGGLKALGEAVVGSGMQFGLWFEPEMVSPDSDLYREHPDWCLHVPDRTRSEGRNQLILDMSRGDVRDRLFQMLKEVLESAPITYVKWDMNRHMTEVGSALLPPDRQKETAHRYILGLYELMEALTTAFPEVLFESCSGGGGRFDPGMLYYMPQTWTSDDTDAVERLKIQYGTSLVYPISSMGAHVSAVPNHQVHRVTSLEMRGHVAMAGNFGYELDIAGMPREELDLVKEQVAVYKEIRETIQFGDFYRLMSPFEGNETAWIFVSPDKQEAVFFYYKVLGEPNEPFCSVRLHGLDVEASYEVLETGEVYGGDEVMHIGINIPMLEGDFKSHMVRLRAV